MRFSLKQHHKTYILQGIGFVGILFFTAMTVAIGNSLYQQASILQEKQVLPQETEYAIFKNDQERESQMREPSDFLAAFLTFIQ